MSGFLSPKGVFGKNWTRECLEMWNSSVLVLVVFCLNHRIETNNSLKH